MPFADLHCHPSFWSFNKNECESDESPTIWNITSSHKQLLRMKDGKRATYAQSDFASLSNGDVMLVCASMYPIEKGFFLRNGKNSAHANLLMGVFNMVFCYSSKRFRSTLALLFQIPNSILGRLLNNEGWARCIVQKHVMNFSVKKIRFFQNADYDYFKTLEQEYNFYVKYSKKDEAPGIAPPAGIRPYKLVINNEDLKTTLSKGQDIAVLLTIEGFHSICLRPKQTNGRLLELVDDIEIMKRIDTLKSWKVFFVTFSHHYNNHLAGHAHSLPLLLSELTDQDENMSEGWIGEKTACYIRKLLSIDANNRDEETTQNRRILIDVKHFSARSRKLYYEDIINKFNSVDLHRKIPVIASHCGYYGPVDKIPFVDLDYLHSMTAAEDDDAIKGGFYRWSINLCDEDVKVIILSGGLIGLSFDQRIMGEKDPREKSPEYWTNVLGRQILAFVASAIANVPDNPKAIWDCLCLGTDFDGLIDPVDVFSTARKLGTLKAELVRFLSVISVTRGKHFFLQEEGYTPAEVVDKITFGNQRKFVEKHFR